MNVYGANVIPSPSDTTAVGRKMLAEHPDNTGGSLGTAISEAVEVALTKPNTRYVLGSVSGLRARPRWRNTASIPTWSSGARAAAATSAV